MAWKSSKWFLLCTATRLELMEALPAQGCRGMGEWMGIGQAGTGSIDIVAVIVCHAVKL